MYDAAAEMLAITLSWLLVIKLFDVECHQKELWAVIDQEEECVNISLQAVAPDIKSNRMGRGRTSESLCS